MNNAEVDKENTSLMVQNKDTDLDDGRWVDTMVTCAETVKKLFVKNTCRLCQTYVDRQVDFEIKNAAQQTMTMESAFLNAAGAMPPVQVELYRQFLFDEESVVDSVGLRDAEEQQPHGKKRRRAAARAPLAPKPRNKNRLQY